MSVRVQSLVWDADLPPHLKLTLLAYADHANDEGESVYPGEERMIRKTGYGSSTIRRHTRALTDLGLLARVARGHTGQRAEFLVVVDEIRRAAHIETLSAGTGCHEGAERVSLVSREGVTRDTPNHQEPSGTTIQKKEVRTRPRDLLWEMFVEVHGEPATKGERGKFNAVVKKLREADVTPEEYPALVAAYSTKHDGLQPGVATVAERVGELRHFVKRGPIRSAGTVEDLAEQQRWTRLREEYGDDEPDADGRLTG